MAVLEVKVIRSPLVHSPAYATALIVNALLLVGQVMVHDEYPGDDDCAPRAVIVVPVAVPATTHPAAVQAFVVDAVQVFSTHVCADPEAAVADMVYPASQLLQSTVAVSHNVPADPVARVGVPFEQVQVLGEHDTVLKAPFVPHVADPLPVYPAVHVTVTDSPVVPVNIEIERKRKEI